MATPTLVLMAGLPGTGKSTLANALSRSLGWPVLDKDLINAPLRHAGMAEAPAAELAYKLWLSLGRAMLVEQRVSVILDSAGRQPFILEQGLAMTQECDARIKVIRCVAPHPIRAARLAQRVAGPSQWTRDDVTDAQEAAWYAHLPNTTLIINTNAPMEAYLSEALTYLTQAT